MNAHRAVNGLWVALGLAICLHSWRLGVWAGTGPRTGAFPFLAGLMILAAGIQLHFRATPPEPISWPSARGLGMIAAILLSLSALAWAAPTFGFLLPGILFIS